MNDGLRAQKTSKDCVIICNPPFDSEEQRNVLKKTLIFFKYLGIKLREDRIKACHILPRTGSHVCPNSVTCKIVYFDEKDRVFGARRKLKKLKYPQYNLNMYINERLPKHEAQINSEAKKMGMITSTKNCAVSVMVRNSQNETSFQPVNYVNYINKVKKAVLRYSAREKPKSGTIYYRKVTSNEQEKYSPEIKSRGNTKLEKTCHITKIQKLLFIIIRKLEAVTLVAIQNLYFTLL